MADGSILCVVGVPYPLAAEIGRQITTGVGSGNADLLCKLGLNAIPAIELARQINVGSFSADLLCRAMWNPTTATALAILLGGASDFGAGWLAGPATTSLDVQNILLQSNNFSNASWGKAGTGVAAPIVTSGVLDPLGGTTAFGLAVPAVTAANTESVLYQAPTANVGFPYNGNLQIQGAVGGEVLWIWGTDGTTFVSQLITCTTNWQTVFVNWTKLNSSSWFFQIGRSLKDGTQTAQASAINVNIWHAQVNLGTTVLPYVATTTSAVVQAFTQTAPSNIRYRDFSGLIAYGSNPIIAQNTAVWNSGGTDSPPARLVNQVAGVLYAATENNQGNPATQSDWNQLAVYTAPVATPLVWTPPAAPVVTNSVGSWDEKWLLHPSIINFGTSVGGGTWKMYYSAEDVGGTSRVGIATASSPSGPWTKYASNPVVSGLGQGQPTVLQIDSLLFMYVGVQNQGIANNGTIIVYYTSTDGLTWTLGDLALTVSAADWENVAGLAGVFDPFVFRNSRGFYEMSYSAGNNASGFLQKMGYAISADGKKWYKYQPSSPFPVPALTTDYGGDPVFFQSGATFYFFYARTTGGGTTCQGNAYTMANH